MTIDSEQLASLASEYAQGMTSIRGRRVQRLVRREFAGADVVLLVSLGSGARAVLGVSAVGAAICGTDGRGSQASVFSWTHGANEAHEQHFDLHKDSLPMLSATALSFTALRLRAGLQASTVGSSRQAGPWVARALEVLA